MRNMSEDVRVALETGSGEGGWGSGRGSKRGRERKHRDEQ